MHHPVQYQTAAKNIQADRLRAAKLSQMAQKDNRRSDSRPGLRGTIAQSLISLLVWIKLIG